MRRVLLIAAALLSVSAAPARAATSTGVVRMDDGVDLSYALSVPDAAAPAGGWPAVVVLHGLAGTKESVASVATTFGAAGYATLAYDARGHGASGGNVELAGPREVADLRAMRDWLASRADVSDSAIGAWGISYGGGQTWNALVAGVPFAAAEVVETWTNLASALWPQDVAKAGVVGGFANSVLARSPLIAGLKDDALNSRLASIKPLLAQRSALARIGTVQTPVFMFQGRVDWAFDLAQATSAFSRLAGPKRLYVGPFGHYPSTFPGPDATGLFTEGIAWFDRYVKGVPNGIGTGVEIVHASGSGTRYAGASLPRTRTVAFGRTTRAGRTLDTWGGGTVTVNVTRLRRYPRLVAVVSAGSQVLTHGAVKPHKGRNTIRLASYCLTIPKGTKLLVRLGSDSGAADIAYASPGSAAPGSISLGRVRTTLSVLR